MAALSGKGLGMENSYIRRSFSGKDYRLGRRLGSGGEGDVYRIAEQPLVAKIYKKPNGRMEQKIRYMILHPVQNVADGGGFSGFSFCTTWPTDVLYADNGQFLGYVMPLIEGNLEMISVERGCTSQDSRRMIPNFNRVFSVIVACNLAKTMAYLHDRNCIIGDLNPKNIQVTAKGGIVLLDADSFDLLDEESGAHYRCCVGTEGYLAPELQGRNLESPNAVFSTYSDCFSLAIHIFQLLMDNYHPFTGVNLIQVKNSTNVNQRMDRIARGISPFVRSYRDLDIPPGAPMLEEMLPGYLVADFYQTFCYTEEEVRIVEKSRTSAKQWAEDLERYLQSIFEPNQFCICEKDSTHFYLRSQDGCGLCKARERAQARK